MAKRKVVNSHPRPDPTAHELQEREMSGVPNHPVPDDFRSYGWSRMGGKIETAGSLWLESAASLSFLPILTIRSLEVSRNRMDTVPGLTRDQRNPGPTVAKTTKRRPTTRDSGPSFRWLATLEPG